ncbi:MAG TPA: hypothetical protein VJR70_11305 [Stellaceae bacterium]|nr:hypothetical protein [Stellaceae bacterium]
MAREIVIDFDVPPDEFYRVWQFGKALHHAFREDQWASISIAAVDRATNQLQVHVASKRRVRRVEKQINLLLEKHFLADRARLSEVTTPD